MKFNESDDSDVVDIVENKEQILQKKLRVKNQN